MKKKYLRLFFSFLLIGLIVVFMTGCSKSSKNDNPSSIVKSKITGQVQKGPFLSGTTLSMAELNSSLGLTGKKFTTQISNNNGFFELDNDTLSSKYVQILADGLYFDEVKGAISSAPLSLYALSDISDLTTINVNVLTHLEKNRVENLVKSGKSFTDAKKQAQSEILSIFGFTLTNMDPSETLDFTVNSDANAILLAISVILQGNRSVDNLTYLMTNISNDMANDGHLTSQSLLTDLRNSALTLNLASIRSNLLKHYQELNINTSIPDFEKYVKMFLVPPPQRPMITTVMVGGDRIYAGLHILAVVNPNSLSTVVSLEYGTTSSYGNSLTGNPSPITGNTPIYVDCTITGLTLGVNYHFNIKAVNALGTTYGVDFTYTPY